jgi:hypothetical protein
MQRIRARTKSSWRFPPQVMARAAIIPSQKFASQKNCHPERNLPRFLRQTEPKDLRLFFTEL